MDVYGPCVWEACPFRAVDALNDVELIYQGRTFRKARVPLCLRHMREAAGGLHCILRPEFLFAVEQPKVARR